MERQKNSITIPLILFGTIIMVIFGGAGLYARMTSKDDTEDLRINQNAQRIFILEQKVDEYGKYIAEIKSDVKHILVYVKH